MCVCVCVCVYVTYIYIYIYIYIYRWCVRVCAFRWVNIPWFRQGDAPTSTESQHVHTCMYARMSQHTHREHWTQEEPEHMLTCMHAHTHTHTHTSPCTCSWARRCARVDRSRFEPIEHHIRDLGLVIRRLGFFAVASRRRSRVVLGYGLCGGVDSNGSARVRTSCQSCCALTVRQRVCVRVWRIFTCMHTCIRTRQNTVRGPALARNDSGVETVPAKLAEQAAELDLGAPA